MAIVAVMLGPGQATVPGTWESQVKVNCVEAGLDFLAACCCNRLTFSCPFAGVIGLFSALAFAIDLEMIPGDSASNAVSKHHQALVLSSSGLLDGGH